MYNSVETESRADGKRQPSIRYEGSRAECHTLKKKNLIPGLLQLSRFCISCNCGPTWVCQIKLMGRKNQNDHVMKQFSFSLLSEPIV